MGKRHTDIGYVEELLRFAAQATWDIDEAYRGLHIYYDLFGHEIISPSYINNLKESLNHYREMYDCFKKCTELHEQGRDFEQQAIDVIVQFHLFVEHMNRGLVDMYVNLLQAVDEELVFQIDSLNLAKRLHNPGDDWHSGYILRLESTLREIRGWTSNLRLDKIKLNRIIQIDLNSVEYIKEPTDWFTEIKSLIGGTGIYISLYRKIPKNSGVDKVVKEAREKNKRRNDSNDDYGLIERNGALAP